MSKFSKILVPVDYSEPSDAALKVAADLARTFRGRLLVLHFLALDVSALADYPIVVGDSARVAKEAERLRDHVRRVLGTDTPPFEVDVSWGSPYLQIVDYAVDWRADLIVIGTHGRTGLKHVLLGSVAEKTVRLAPCPVLTVRGEVREPAARATELGNVAAVMQPNPATIGPHDTLELARARMAEAKARHLPVVDGGHLVGVLSDRDLLAYTGYLDCARVKAVMSSDPITASPETRIEAAARLMLERRVRALPVVDGERLVGILSSSDILEDYVRAARS